MDDIDRAQEYAELYRQEALQRHFAGRVNKPGAGHRGVPTLDRGVGRDTPPDPPPGGRRCSDCEEPIDPARLQANPDAVRCVDCQMIEERKRRS
jgi:hypothetical protein